MGLDTLHLVSPGIPVGVPMRPGRTARRRSLMRPPGGSGGARRARRGGAGADRTRGARGGGRRRRPGRLLVLLSLAVAPGLPGGPRGARRGRRAAGAPRGPRGPRSACSRAASPRAPRADGAGRFLPRPRARAPDAPAGRLSAGPPRRAQGSRRHQAVLSICARRNLRRALRALQSHGESPSRHRTLPSGRPPRDTASGPTGAA